MAERYAARWRPQSFRSTLETIIEGAPPNEQRVETLQLVAYDDTDFTAGNPYLPGTTATESKLVIVEEKTVRQAISAFAGKTQIQSTAIWDAAKATQITAWQADPNIVAKVRAARGAYLSVYTLIQ